MNLCIHVGTIHVYLTSIVVNNLADLINSFFIDTMSWRIRNLYDRKKINNWQKIHDIYYQNNLLGSIDHLQTTVAHTIRADKLSLCASAAFLTSSILILPLASVPTETIFIPHIAALAGLVPWAETGMMHTLRWWSPRDYI